MGIQGWEPAAVAALTLTSGWAFAQTNSAASGPIRTPVVLKCTVQKGPRYTDCAANDEKTRDPERLKDTIQRTEDMPPCMILKGSPGERVDVKADVYDRPVGKVSYVLNPDWDARAIAGLIPSVYPEKAFDKGISGHVSISCEVAVNRMARHCQVVSETPPNYGFGRASLELARNFRFKPMLKDCVPVGGAEVTLPLDYKVLR